MERKIKGFESESYIERTRFAIRVVMGVVTRPVCISELSAAGVSSIKPEINDLMRGSTMACGLPKGSFKSIHGSTKGAQAIRIILARSLIAADSKAFASVPLLMIARIRCSTSRKNFRRRSCSSRATIISRSNSNGVFFIFRRLAAIFV